ncbi:MAG: outer membrane protein transport protein [Candidatus Aureabacteria bacterium]|nr:outer membrane protein transport protein [Candidatus Auribacterota bacterium]
MKRKEERMDRRNSLVFLAAAALFFASALPLLAGGYEWGGFAGRSGAMGGAFIGLADDWTANYWNPAGLAQLTGREIGIDLLSPQPTMKGSESYLNLPPTPETAQIYKYSHDVFINYLGIEPNNFEKTKTSDAFYHPNGIGGYGAFPALTVGGAVYSPLGYYSDWEDTIPFGMGTIHAKNYEELVIVEPQLTVAKEILPGFYAGAGVGLLYNYLERTSEKTVSNSGIADYTYDFRIKNDGVGVEGLFGLLYHVTEKLSVGAVYRTGATVKMTGTASSSLSLMGLSEETDVTQKFRNPATWGIGVAIKPIPGVLTLTADWQRTEWDTWRTDVEFDQDGLLLASENYDEGWKSSNRYRFGCEFWATAKWALRAGFMWDESPMPDRSVSLAYIPDVNRKAVSLGVGFKPAKEWQIDALAAYAWGKRETDVGEFEQQVPCYSLGASYLF